MSQSYSCVAKRNSSVMVIITHKKFVMVIITLKTILNEKVGYHFCQVILLFWLRPKVVPYTKYKKYRSNYEYVDQKLSRPQEKRQTTPGWKPLI